MTTNTRSKLIMVLISLVSVLAIGCGDSQKDYVFTGTVPTASTGNVRFLLDRLAAPAQAADIPNVSRSAYIEFFDAENRSVGAPAFPTSAQLTGTGAQQFEVVVTGVPASAVAYELTIYDANNIPLLFFTDNIAISVGNTVTADLDEALEQSVDLVSVDLTPATAALTNMSRTVQLTVFGTYSNGDQLNLTSFTNTSLDTYVDYEIEGEGVNVTATGLVTAVFNGNTTVRAIVTSYGNTANDSASVSVTGIPGDG